MESSFLSETGLAHLVLKMVTDLETENIHVHGIETIFGHTPAGSSFRCFEHFQQIMRDRKFQKFDFGPERNVKEYGSEQPPEYDLSKVKDVPIALINGALDGLASPKDTEWLTAQLSS